MKAPELAALYLLIGLGSAFALFARRGLQRAQAVDLALMVAVWPLYGPFLLSAGSSHAEKSRGTGLEFLEALLPDDKALTELARRVESAEERVREIDRLFLRPEFSEDLARARLNELGDPKDEGARRATESRIANIRRLRSLKERSLAELDQIAELLAQLRVQAEVVRLSGAPEDRSKELIAELLGRVEGLDLMLVDESNDPRPSGVLGTEIDAVAAPLARDPHG